MPNDHLSQDHARVPSRRLPGCWLRAASAVLAATGLLSAAHVEVRLANGSTITGEVVRRDAGEIVIKQILATRTGAITAQRVVSMAEVASVVDLLPPAEEYAKRRAGARSADDHVALARWCGDSGLAGELIAEAIAALGVQSDHPAALTLLRENGMALVDGKWVVEADALRAQGKVRYRGQIRTLAEADALRAQDAREQALAEQRKILAVRDADLAASDKRILELTARVATLATAATAARADLAAAEAERASADAAKTAAVQLQTQISRDLNQAISQRPQAPPPRPAQPGKPPPPQPPPPIDHALEARIARLQADLDRAQADARAATARFQAAETKMATARQTLTNLDGQRTRAQADLDYVTTSRARTAKARDEAAARITQLEAAVRDGLTALSALLAKPATGSATSAP